MSLFMIEIPERKILKETASNLLDTAQVPAKKMALLYLGLTALLSMADYLSGTLSLFSTFASVLTTLMSTILSAGFTLYCMAVRRYQHAEYLVLFDGFSLTGKIILLQIVQNIFIFLWSLLFVIPGIIASYRYRFALYFLLEDQELGVMEALALSKQHTAGFKGRLFMLDMSYLGWIILAGLPQIVYNLALQRQTQILMIQNGIYDIQAVMDMVSADALGFPAWGWQCLTLIFVIFVGIFYIPQYKCVDLAYFDLSRGQSDSTDSFWDIGSGEDSTGNSYGGSSFGNDLY